MKLPIFTSHSASDFTVAYEPASIAGEPGWSFAIYQDAREVASGWSRGKRADAEQEAKAAMGRVRK
jgi:hypothetical protein